jgi:hypothetical protein
MHYGSSRESNRESASSWGSNRKKQLILVKCNVLFFSSILKEEKSWVVEY